MKAYYYTNLEECGPAIQGGVLIEERALKEVVRYLFLSDICSKFSQMVVWIRRSASCCFFDGFFCPSIKILAVFENFFLSYTPFAELK